MRADVNLRLLFNSLKSLALAPYFSNEVLQYNEHLCRAIEFALEQGGALPVPVVNTLAAIVWTAHRYLSGSVFREAPYEVQYCLEHALRPWAKKKIIITTALSDEPFGYHFESLDPWASIQHVLPNFDNRGFDRELALIGVPKLYRQKPVFCGPLYHELGHFVDRHWGVTNMAMVMSRRGLNAIPPGSLLDSHWREHFSDLFAASYIGMASVRPLEIINPGAPTTSSHPSNASRIQMIEKFLAGTADPLIDAINLALQAMSAPQLFVRYARPNIGEAFDDLRPAVIDSEGELHGLFESSLEYFVDSLQRPISPWTGRKTSSLEVEKIVNDLAEKSIRSFSIRQAWKSHVNSESI